MEFKKLKAIYSSHRLVHSTHGRLKYNTQKFGNQMNQQQVVHFRSKTGLVVSCNLKIYEKKRYLSSRPQCKCLSI